MPFPAQAYIWAKCHALCARSAEDALSLLLHSERACTDLEQKLRGAGSKQNVAIVLRYGMVMAVIAAHDSAQLVMLTMLMVPLPLPMLCVPQGVAGLRPRLRVPLLHLARPHHRRQPNGHPRRHSALSAGLPAKCALSSPLGFLYDAEQLYVRVTGSKQGFCFSPCCHACVDCRWLPVARSSLSVFSLSSTKS